MMFRKIRIGRRRFIKSALAGAGLAIPQIVSPSVLGRAGGVAPSGRITLGCIGVGGMGQGDMHTLMGCPGTEVIAVCDVKRTMREQAQSAANGRYGSGTCAAYNDFRDLVARDDIDAVSIASLDSWHVLHALAAVQAGKDVYVEKPLGMSIEEIKTLRDAVHRTGRIFQFGTQQRSMQEFRVACELVRNGRIGKLHTIEVGVHAGAAERSGLKQYNPEPVPDGFDYDLWLGPSPWQPYTPTRVVNPHWFHISDYSLGYVSGWGIHHIDIAQWGNGTEHTGPVEVEATAQFPGDDALCDNPVSWDAWLQYENGVKMHYTGAGPGLDGVRHGITFLGSEGWVWVNRGAIESRPAELLREKIGPGEIRLPVSTLHQQDFLNGVRSRGETLSNIDVAVRSDTVCQMVWVALHLQRKLRWDPLREEFVDDAAANRMMQRAMRAPWHL